MSRAAPISDEDALAACRWCSAQPGEPCDAHCRLNSDVALRSAAPEVCDEEGPDAS